MLELWQTCLLSVFDHVSQLLDGVVYFEILVLIVVVLYRVGFCYYGLRQETLKLASKHSTGVDGAPKFNSKVNFIYVFLP